MRFGFSSTSPSPETGDTFLQPSAGTFPPQLSPSSTVSALSEKTCDSTTPSYYGSSFSNASSSTSASLGPTTTSITTTSVIVSATESVTVHVSCSSEQDEVVAILASQCEKFLSCRAARQAQGRRQDKRHDSASQPWVFGATGFETTSSSKPANSAAHASAATFEQNYGESKPCSVPITGAPSTSTLSAPLSDSSVLPSLQLAEEEQPYIQPVDLLHSTIEMWERVVANKKTDQEVTEEGLRHFYEGINYFCLQSKRLQEATAKYNEAAKASDDLKNVMAPLKDKLAEANRKLEDSEKEKERLEHELAGAANTITALTGEKESLLRVQTILHQKIVELKKELEEAGPAAIQKYKASSLHRQELMEYAAPYMGNGVKLAIEKIKAKDPTFDPKIYGLEIYMLPTEADVEEFSTEEEGDGGADQPMTSNNKEPTIHGISVEEATVPPSSA
ncbi:hyphally regulated cell wall protein 3-like isoform X1 [Nicotiana tomentosiformis]|uniref:hyphally regulated cell wall protein 3-like isoform X1 n=1 Tax=Nicotiana tomentosiformis TaxID=4098 RepID=UPI00051AE289|nr:uncharacterized protein LOC104094207 [Nicotiana tomentosiformis]